MTVFAVPLRRPQRLMHGNGRGQRLSGHKHIFQRIEKRGTPRGSFTPPEFRRPSTRKQHLTVRQKGGRGIGTRLRQLWPAFPGLAQGVEKISFFRAGPASDVPAPVTTEHHESPIGQSDRAVACPEFSRKVWQLLHDQAPCGVAHQLGRGSALIVGASAQNDHRLIA